MGKNSGVVRRVFVPMLAIAAIIALVASCDDGSRQRPSSASVSTTTAASVAPYTPRYEVVDCASSTFAGLDAPPIATCGLLTVPEDRTVADGRKVILPVVSLQPVAPPAPDSAALDSAPVVYLSGGPGDAAISDLSSGIKRTFPLDRPTILVDQRGTGRSVPSLECVEVNEVFLANQESTDDLDTESARAKVAFEKCRARLAPDADLNQYNTPAMAADMADLRTAMKLDKWSIYGISYGTAIGLEILRSHPDGLESAVLDSVVTPDLDEGPASAADRRDAAFERLFSACSTDPECAASRPDFRGDLLKVRERLNATPHRVEFADSEGAARVANLTGDDVISGTFQAMYDTTLIPLLAAYAGRLASGDDSLLDVVAPSLLGSVTLPADGQTQSVLCADRAATATPGDVKAIREAYPLVGGLIDAGPCENWEVSPVDAGFHTVRKTKVPTLVVGGAMDPITPAEDSRRVAEQLGASATFVEFPGVGHGALFSGDACPVAIANEFLAAPGADLDTSCAAAMALNFAL